MYLLTVLSIIVTFQIPATLATCNKTFQMVQSTLQTNDGILSAGQQQQQQQQQQQESQQPQRHQSPSEHHHHRQTFDGQNTTTGNYTNDTRTSSPGNSSLTVSDEVNFSTSGVVAPIDLRDFRLEYNKYKILSHLGITANLEEREPQLDDDLRNRLAATNSFSNSLDSSSSSGARHKRSLSCDQLNGNKNACCLENFYVNFTHIGWDKWILYPAGYNANYCRGQCDLSHARYYHSTLLSKYSNVVSLCCSPKQMAPLRLLYIDEDNKVHQKSIPDMIVESCDCA